MKTLLKVLKFLGICIIVLAIALVLIYLYADNKKDIGKDFREKIQTTSTIETKYLQKGNLEVEKLVINAEKPIGKYSIFYPKEMKETNKKYPLLFVVNGTGGKATKYESLFEHYASWGFIVVGT